MASNHNVSVCGNCKRISAWPQPHNGITAHRLVVLSRHTHTKKTYIMHPHSPSLNESIEMVANQHLIVCCIYHIVHDIYCMKKD